MIVGNYYINNFLVLSIILAVSGVAAYFAGVPGMILGEETETGQEFDIRLETGELNSGENSAISLLNSEGNPVSQEEVYVNNERVGETDQEGKVEFVVPDSQSITVSASVSGSEVNEVFEVRSEDESNSDNDGSNDGNRSDDGNVDDNQSSSDGNNDQDSDQTDEDDGTTDDGGSDEDDETVSTDPSIDLNKPSDGEVFKTFTGENLEIELSGSVDVIEQGTYSLKVNGISVENNSIKSGVNSIAVNRTLSSGEYTWSLEVEGQGFSTLSNIRNFEIKEIEPKEGLFIEGNVSVGNMININLFQDNEPVEAEEIIVNGITEGYTDAEGKLEFEVPDVKEIEIITASGIDSTTQQVEGYESSTQIDIEFDSDLVSGQINTLTVLSDGKTVSSRPVYVDGEYEGETGSNGDLNFEVPNKDSFNVYTQVDGVDFNETFDTSSPTYEVSLQSPSDGEQIDDFEVPFELDVNLPNDAYINGYWINKTSGDSNRMFREIIPSNQDDVNWTKAFEKADEYNWYVEVENLNTRESIKNSSEQTFETLKGEDDTVEYSGGGSSGG